MTDDISPEGFFNKFISLLNNIDKIHYIYLLLLILLLTLLISCGNWNKSETFFQNIIKIPENIFVAGFLILSWPLKIVSIILFGTFLFWLIFKIPELLLIASDFKWKEFLIRTFGITCIIYSSYIFYIERHLENPRNWMRTRLLCSTFVGIYTILIY